MASLDPPPPPADQPSAKRRKCGNCSQFGHKRRTCPSAPVETAVATVVNGPRNRNRVGVTQQLDPFAVSPVTDPNSINWSNVLCVVFDLETTGRSRRNSEIIEIAAVVLDKNGIPIKDGNFVSYVRPKKPIPSYIVHSASHAVLS